MKQAVEFKSKISEYGLPLFTRKNGKTERLMFRSHTLRLEGHDTEAIEYVTDFMEDQKENSKQRTVFTPAEFQDISTTEDTYLTLDDGTKVHFKQARKLVKFALDNGANLEGEPIVVSQESKVHQGTITSDKADKESQPKIKK